MRILCDFFFKSLVNNMQVDCSSPNTSIIYESENHTELIITYEENAS